ncbi:unnamed protein product, partial [Mesorhabditis spiculigera]
MALSRYFLFFLQLIPPILCLTCVEEISKSPYVNDSKPRTCEGDMCWVMFMQHDNRTYRQCMSGFSYEPGCRLDFFDNKPSNLGWLCMCNHADKCNAGSPVFTPGPENVTSSRAAAVAGKSLPTTDFRPTNLCYTYHLDSSSQVAPDVTVLPDPSKTRLASNTTMTAEVCMVRIPETLGTCKFSTGDPCLESNQTFIGIGSLPYTSYTMNLLEVAMIDKTMPVYMGGIYASQFDTKNKETLMLCAETNCNYWTDSFRLYDKNVTCMVGTEKSNTTCKAQSCIQVADATGKIVKNGCFWQDDTKAEHSFKAGKYSLSSSTLMYICTEDFCNEGSIYLGFTRTTMPPTAATTSQALVTTTKSGNSCVNGYISFMLVLHRIMCAWI